MLYDFLRSISNNFWQKVAKYLSTVLHNGYAL